MAHAIAAPDDAVRPPAVAGIFYPDDPAALTNLIDDCLGAAVDHGPRAKALIAPHAGFVYSGPIAGSAYKAVAERAAGISRVILLGPPHRAPVRQFAIPSVSAFATPLGTVPLDPAGIAAALRVPGVAIADEPHRQEHSLEVQLPFLQRLLGDFTFVPILVGAASPAATDALLEALWGGAETLVVISSDLSHYHPYEAARRLDRDVSHAVETLVPADINDEQACGRHAMRGLLSRAAALDLRATTLDLRNSGDTAGPRDSVVGYGAWALEDGATARLSEAERERLLDAARRSIRNGVEHDRPARVKLGTFTPSLEAVRATFVTLEMDGELRGCIGSVAPQRPLIEDVAVNAFKAAFKDPRFARLTAAEAARLAVSISVLSHPRPLPAKNEAEAIAWLEPHVDGVILEAGDKRGLFLPQVWSHLGEPAAFLRQLKCKAGLAADAWPADTRLWRFRTESFGDTVTR